MTRGLFSGAVSLQAWHDIPVLSPEGEVVEYICALRPDHPQLRMFVEIIRTNSWLSFSLIKVVLCQCHGAWFDSMHSYGSAGVAGIIYPEYFCFSRWLQ